MTKKLPNNCYVVVDSTPESVLLHKPLNCDPDRWDVFDLHVRDEHSRSINLLSHDGNMVKPFPMAYDHVLKNGKYPLKTVPVGAVLCWWGFGYNPEYGIRPKKFDWDLYQETVDKILKAYGQKE